jgi:hypothetical protein
MNFESHMIFVDRYAPVTVANSAENSVLQAQDFQEVSGRLLSFDMIRNIYHLCGLVVRVPGYRSRDPEFDSRRYQIF